LGFRDKKTGMMKGDGTVTFLLKPSVRLATTLMDGRPLRPGTTPIMRVQEAKFQLKGDFVAKKKQSGAKAVGKGGGKGGNKKVVSQQEKLLSWSGYDDSHKASEVSPNALPSGTIVHIIPNTPPFKDYTFASTKSIPAAHG
jgi:hypothetical protein